MGSEQESDATYSIREHGRIETVQYSWQERFCSLLEHFLLRCVHPEDVVENVSADKRPF